MPWSVMLSSMTRQAYLEVDINLEFNSTLGTCLFVTAVSENKGKNVKMTIDAILRPHAC
jgi:hypothetical protein